MLIEKLIKIKLFNILTMFFFDGDNDDDNLFQNFNESLIASILL